MSEEWKVILGYDGAYEVSDLGRVRSWKNGKWGRREEPRLMKMGLNDHGYWRVTLTRDGAMGYHLVHRLVLLAFVGEPPTTEHQAAHINGHPLDASLPNLYWATVAENGEDRARHGRLKGESHGNATLTEENVIEAVRLHNLGLGDATVAKRLGVTRAAIGRIIRREGWTHVTETLDIRSGRNRRGRNLRAPGRVAA